MPPVKGDRVHLSQVLLNLIINAMDAVEGLPDVRRRIAIEAHLEVDHMVEITVADSGVRIAADLVGKRLIAASTTGTTMAHEVSTSRGVFPVQRLNACENVAIS
jgi:phosphoglycerate-specific signal transduction histidine kinase